MNDVQTPRERNRKKQIIREIESLTRITFSLEDKLRKVTERLIQLKIEVGNN